MTQEALQIQQKKMRITYDGNVGIGTTSPGAELDVVGDISCSIIKGLNFGSAASPTIRYGNLCDRVIFPK